MVEIVPEMERIMIIVEKRGINGSQLYSVQVYANFWTRLYTEIHSYDEQTFDNMSEESEKKH